MQLRTLLNDMPRISVEGSLDREVTSLAYDSRRVKKGTLFFALRGQKADGNSYVEQAINAGAAAVVSEVPVENSKVTSIVVLDARKAMADVAVAYYQNPARHLKVTGVTGTNGKTTVSFLLKHICQKALLRSGLIGTVRYEVGERILPATHTTPESLDLQELLFQIRSAGDKAAVMEVSSHALVQERVRGVEFDTAVFTNLTQDHLDFHGNMGNYFESKSLLFAMLSSQSKKKGKAVINIDDRYGVRLVEKFSKSTPLLTYGLGLRADFRASNIKIDFNGTTYQLDAYNKSYLVRLPLIGRFNVYNSLAAIAAASSLGVDVRTAVANIASAPPVPGRLQAVALRRQFKVFVDYAHTDDALLNVMRTLRELSPNRLIVVFGCGGDRDRAKRPLMGAVVEQNADYAIITSDNPRKESPEAIIEDIKSGFRSKKYEVIVERKEAIFRAIAMAGPRDIVLIAGKGHECYQEFADHTVPFDDAEVALSAGDASPVAM